MPRAVGINHVAVEVGSIDEALAFFETIFGELTLRGRGRNMAFIDLGDQFIALEAGRSRHVRGQTPDMSEGHIGLVVDDQQATMERARDAGATMLGGHDFLDPWGNHWQVVDYRHIQFTKTPRVLEGMGLAGLEKSEQARAELREKGLAD